MTRQAKTRPPAKSPRTVFHVVPHGDDWAVEVEGRIIQAGWSKSVNIKCVRARCQHLRRAGILAQIVVHRRDGAIQTEWTYGKDPRRTKG